MIKLTNSKREIIIKHKNSKQRSLKKKLMSLNKLQSIKWIKIPCKWNSFNIKQLNCKSNLMIRRINMEGKLKNSRRKLLKHINLLRSRSLKKKRLYLGCQCSSKIQYSSENRCLNKKKISQQRRDNQKNKSSN